MDDVHQAIIIEVAYPDDAFGIYSGCGAKFSGSTKGGGIDGGSRIREIAGNTVRSLGL